MANAYTHDSDVRGGSWSSHFPVRDGSPEFSSSSPEFCKKRVSRVPDALEKSEMMVKTARANHDQVKPRESVGKLLKEMAIFIVETACTFLAYGVVGCVFAVSAPYIYGLPTVARLFPSLRMLGDLTFCKELHGFITFNIVMGMAIGKKLIDLPENYYFGPQKRQQSIGQLETLIDRLETEMKRLEERYKQTCPGQLMGDRLHQELEPHFQAYQLAHGNKMGTQESDQGGF